MDGGWLMLVGVGGYPTYHPHTHDFSGMGSASYSPQALHVCGLAGNRNLTSNGHQPLNNALIRCSASE